MTQIKLKKGIRIKQKMFAGILFTSLGIGKVLTMMLSLLAVGGWRFIWMIVLHYRLRLYQHEVFTEISTCLTELDGILKLSSVSPNKKNLAFDYLTAFLLSTEAQAKADIKEVKRLGFLGTALTKRTIIISIKNIRALHMRVIQKREQYPNDAILRFQELQDPFNRALTKSVKRELDRNKLLFTPKLLLDMYLTILSGYINSTVRDQFPTFLAVTNGLFKRYSYIPAEDGYFQELIDKEPGYEFSLPGGKK